MKKMMSKSEQRMKAMMKGKQSMPAEGMAKVRKAFKKKKK